MRISRSKTVAAAISLFLMLSIATSLFAVLPTANAVGLSIPTFVYVSTSRPVIGVGQDLLLIMWTNNVPLDIGEGEGRVPSPSGRQSWRHGIYMELTKPNGEVQTFTIAESDPIGGAYVAYVPDQVGTYYLQGFFPAVWKNMTDEPFNNYYYEAGESVKLPFTVTEEQVQPWVESPLPVSPGYFTRPISEAARQWNPLLGDWLSGAANVWPSGSYGGNTQRFVYSEGPESAHILWTKPVWAGGIMTADYGDTGYQTSHYQGIDFTPIILGGKIYMAYRDTAHTAQGYLCVDLYTGKRCGTRMNLCRVMVRSTIMSRLISMEASRTCGELQASNCQKQST